MKRKTDSQHQAHFRTFRMFQEGDEWFFRVRGGFVMGPYASELDASSALEVYIRKAQSGLLSDEDKVYVTEMLADSAG